MADFTAITTQEQFDAIIGERLKREKETYSKKYADYDDLKSQVDMKTQLQQHLEECYSAEHKAVSDLLGSHLGLQDKDDQHTA